MFIPVSPSGGLLRDALSRRYRSFKYYVLAVCIAGKRGLYFKCLLRSVGGSVVGSGALDATRRIAPDVEAGPRVAIGADDGWAVPGG